MARNRMYSNKRRSSAPDVSRYTQKTLRRDREYGFYWYAWLWKAFRPVLVFLCALVIVAGVVVSAANIINQQFFMAVSPGDAATVDFTIEKGRTIAQIGGDLLEQNLIRNQGIFKYIVQFKGLTGKFQYGNYPLSRDMDINQIIDQLTQGSASNERTITIIPGWTVEEIAENLKKQGALTDTKEFLALSNDFDQFVEKSYTLQAAKDAVGRGERRYQLEGYLAPDTYRVYTNATPTSLIETLLKQTETVVDRVFNAAPATEVVYDERGEIIGEDDSAEEPEEEVPFATTLTPDQTIILASIIEKEAGKKGDYAKVAAVFHNRLERGMRLESDVTVAYPLGIRRLVLTTDELATVNGYNTYTKSGLPVGPVCNPSKDAIQAALYPDTEYIYDGYLYFCAGDPEKGELLFAKTKDEHNANVAKYRSMWIDYDEKQATATPVPTEVPAG